MDSLRVIHADDRFVVVDKPAGLLSVPGKGPTKADCAVARVRAMFAHARGPMIVHRLDMDTSGLLLIALEEDAQRTLSAQFERRNVEKRYIALLHGMVDRESGLIDFPIRPDLDRRPYQIHDPVHGREARTRFRVLSYEIDRTRVEFRPITGRAHQIRVHAAHPLGLRCPVVGDVLYAGEAPGERAPRLMLHAAGLAFDHPTSGARLEFSIPTPF